MRWIAPLMTLLTMLATSSTLFAHPGHGVTDPQTVAHQLVEPVHAVPWMLIVAVGITLLGALFVLKRSQHRRVAATSASRRRSTDRPA